MATIGTADANDVLMQAYRNRASEQARSSDLMALVPPRLESALDIGARDGHLSRMLAGKLRRVTALDLERPTFTHERVECVKGDVTALAFPDGAFDLVLCAEVLEHVPALEKACAELARVSGRYLLIGVPNQQDIRLGRTTCRHCGGKNPPWGHINSFDERRIARLFPGFAAERTSFVGTTREATNTVSASLMDFAGNPYGTYVQDEPCVHCGQRLVEPAERSLPQKVATKIGHHLQRLQVALSAERGNWLHVLLRRG